MKVKRMLAVDKELYDRLNNVCENEGFYRNSFVVNSIAENIEGMNDYPVYNGRIRTKDKKARFQIYIEEELYNSIQQPKGQRIERILEEVIKVYE